RMLSRPIPPTVPHTPRNDSNAVAVIAVSALTTIWRSDGRAGFSGSVSWVSTGDPEVRRLLPSSSGDRVVRTVTYRRQRTDNDPMVSMSSWSQGGSRDQVG